MSPGFLEVDLECHSFPAALQSVSAQRGVDNKTIALPDNLNVERSIYVAKITIDNVNVTVFDPASIAGPRMSVVVPGR